MISRVNDLLVNQLGVGIGVAVIRNIRLLGKQSKMKHEKVGPRADAITCCAVLRNRWVVFKSRRHRGNRTSVNGGALQHLFARMPRLKLAHSAPVNTDTPRPSSVRKMRRVIYPSQLVRAHVASRNYYFH